MLGDGQWADHLQNKWLPEVVHQQKIILKRISLGYHGHPVGIHQV
jgi:hypothetical protein